MPMGGAKPPPRPLPSYATDLRPSSNLVQWRSSHLAILAVRQGRLAARGRQNEASQSTKQAKKGKQEIDLQKGR